MGKVEEKKFLLSIPRSLYTKELQKMFDYIRYKKATKNSKATASELEKVLQDVRKARNEKKLASQYL